MTLFYVTPDNPKPCGGVKTRYRHVDILNRHGIPACILHEKAGFRCTWFDNNTPVTSFETLSRAHAGDLLVLTEVHGPHAHTMAKGLLKKVIFNQGVFNTFNGYSLDTRSQETPYTHPDVLAVIVNSEYAFEYIHHVFPRIPLFRIHYGIDTTLFHPRPKKKQLVYLPTKNIRDILQVINILKFRGTLSGWDLVPIDQNTETETAAILGESSVFLNFTLQEGFGMPAVEALACGCLVIGYDGISGREYLRPDFSHIVPHNNILAFVHQVEKVLTMHEKEPNLIEQKRASAVEYIQKLYYPEREEKELVSAWLSITGLQSAK